MTTMDYTATLRALKMMKVETGSLVCLGCGLEHNCSIHGCAIIRNAVEHMEAALANYDHLSALVDQQTAEFKLCQKYLADSEAARAELGNRLAAAQKELHEAKSEIEEAVRERETLKRDLKAYKDTGLEPEGIIHLGEDWKAEHDALVKYLALCPIDHLRELVQAEQDGRLVVLPKVAEADWKAFVDGLHDYFIESKFEDRSVGIFGMTDGEIALADALMKALAREETEEAMAQEGGKDHA